MSESDMAAPPHVRELTLEDFAPFVPSAAEIRESRIVGFNSRDRRSQAFSVLRTMLSKRMEEKNCRLLGITSAAPDAGKSFLSMNLAASLSRVTDEPVFLVDLDLRRASVAGQIGMECDGGIARLLSGELSGIEKVGRRIEGTRLVVFPTARVTDASDEYVAGAHFAALIDELRDRCPTATIIFDLPPAFASDDAMLIMQRLDGYVIAVDSGRTRKSQISEVLRHFHPKPCIGAILNRYRGGIMDSYGYGYGSYAYSAYYD